MLLFVNFTTNAVPESNLIFHKITVTRSLTGTNGKHAIWSREKSQLFKLRTSVSLCGNCKSAWSQDGHGREENIWSDPHSSEMYLSQQYFSPSTSLTFVSSFSHNIFHVYIKISLNFTCYSTVWSVGHPCRQWQDWWAFKKDPSWGCENTEMFGFGFFFSETDFCSEWKMP